MKRTIKLLMILFMFMLIPNILKAAEVSIENITLVDHSDLLSEKTPASASGLNVNFDVSFTNLDDFAKYKVVINNPTNTEYEVQQETDFTSSDHIVYTYSYEGDSKILKANSKLVMYITLTYKYEVQPDELTDGKFVEKNKLTVNLSNGTENPKTADASTIVLFALVLMFIGSVGLYKYTHRKEFLGTLVALAVLIPVYAYAAEKLKLNVETQITVEEKHLVSYYAFETVKKGEEGKYELLDSNGSMEGMCSPTKNENYVLCFAKLKSEAYSEGETVNMLDSITVHSVNNAMEVVENTIKFDGTQMNLPIPHIFSNPVIFYNTSGEIEWEYNSNLNSDNNINFNSQLISNYLGMYGSQSIFIGTPATFTMPDHDVIFIANNYTEYAPPQ